MKRMGRLINFRFLSILIILFGAGCNKFLSEKPDKSLAVPSTLKDLQALLDNNGTLNSETNAGEISSGDFYLTQADWASLSSEANRRAYIWEKDYLFESNSTDWLMFSTTVYYCNTVLEGLQNIERSNSNFNQYDNIKGQALFFRAKHFLAASLIWAPVYDETTASKDLGLPLRKNTNFNEKSVRSSVKETYELIISDLKQAISLLPNIPLSYVRPSKPAAYACLSRTFLAMGKYKESGLYADSCLQLSNELIDYNSLAGSSASYPFVTLNKEVLVDGVATAGQILTLTRARIVDELYQQYDADDLRKTLFFTTNADGSHGFKGRYTGRASLFLGIATDEMYLTRAECLARNKQPKEAMLLLNKLLLNRWRSGKFQTFIADNEVEALDLILKERRKELLFRGLRWLDLKRLNKEGRGITLKRTLDGKAFILSPNDLRYALPIPEDVIELSGMQQNPR